MAEKRLRGAIVGASSLLGRELADELAQTAPAAWGLTPPAWELTLLDAAAPEDVAMEEESAEELTIQPITAESFADVDVAFFAGDEAMTRGYWQAAHAAGASVVDLTGALAGQPDVLLRGGAAPGRAPDLATAAVSVAHPAAIMLALAAERLQPFGLRRMTATVMEPASQQGSAGVDEMHQQTVALLSFKPLDKEVFDAQIAFSLRAALGETAKTDLAAIGKRIEREAKELAGVDRVGAVSVQLLQAPVFHGSTASVWVELGSSVEESAVRSALKGEGVRVAAAREDVVSNESVAGDAEIAVTVRSAAGLQRPEMGNEGALRGQRPETDGAGSAFWLWMAADNLRLIARGAAQCAAELAALRPGSGVN